MGLNDRRKGLLHDLEAQDGPHPNAGWLAPLLWRVARTGEARIDTLEQLRRLMLDFHRHRPRARDRQGTRAQTARRTGPGKRRADNLLPVQHQPDKRRPWLAKGGRCNRGQDRTERPRHKAALALLLILPFPGPCGGRGVRLALERNLRHRNCVPPSASALLAWYDRHHRTLPWRAIGTQRADPYHVWLSEIMLQQTTVASVIPYYARFLARFPTLETLADAPLDDVLSLWAGLGYYSRARNLHRCAQAVQSSGAFPRSVEGLKALPGIGDYTARAVAAIAFGVPTVPVDGNVERVTARLFNIEAPLPGSRRLLASHAATLNADAPAQARTSDFVQALFDLGATICTPRNPACALCPWRESCAAQKAGTAATLPRRAAKAPKSVRYGVVFALSDTTDALWLRKRPDTGLLGGMTELPGTPWREEPWALPEALHHAPALSDWSEAGSVRHVFTHFTLHLTVLTGHLADGLLCHDHLNIPGFSCNPSAMAALALPTVMRKCLALTRHHAPSEAHP